MCFLLIVVDTNSLMLLFGKGAGQPDTCQPQPTELLETLPPGCLYMDENDVMHTSLDIGKCRGEVCISSSYIEDGNCQLETTYCCATTTYKVLPY